jgi:hypothetical protein
VRYTVQIAESLASPAHPASIALIYRLGAVLSRAGHVEATSENWDFRIEIANESDRLRTKDKATAVGPKNSWGDLDNLENAWTFRMSRLLCDDWNISWRLLGPEVTDRGVAASTEAVERELALFTNIVGHRDRDGSPTAPAPPVHRLWAPPGLLRRVAHHVVTDLVDVIVVSSSSRATLTIEEEEEVTGRSKDGVWYGEGQENRRTQLQRIGQGVTFVPSSNVLRVLGKHEDAPLDSGYLGAFVSEVRAWILAVPGIRRSIEAGSAGHVFISYVSEDSDVVDRLQRDLEAVGISVWRDRTSLPAGVRWKDSVRTAIAGGSSFICCFSEASSRRTKSYMNEELTLAVDELRQRGRDTSWFLPVVLPGGAVPDWSIGGGENLRDFNYTMLSDSIWDVGLQKLRMAVTRPMDDRNVSYPPVS